MDFYGWNETQYGNPSPGPDWSYAEEGTVYDTLNYPVEAPEESVRTLLVRIPRLATPRRIHPTCRALSLGLPFQHSTLVASKNATNT
jgi:hypothetical protein